MINYAGIIIIILLSVGLIRLFFFLSKEKQKNIQKDIQIEKLNNQLLKTLKEPVIIGFIEKYTEKDIDNITRAKDAIESFKNYIAFHIAIKTDLIRTRDTSKSTDEMIGYLNCLHEILAFLTQLSQPKRKEDKYEGKELL